MTKFIDPWNPTTEEIKNWAYDESDKFTPEQDWDLALCHKEYIDTILQLTSDRNCPKKFFFLQCLYEHTCKYLNETAVLETTLEKASKIADPEVQSWITRTRQVLTNPDSFDHDEWDKLLIPADKS